MAVGVPPSIDIPPVPGFRFAATASGIKASGTDDLLLFAMTPGCHAAGVFTRNQIVAAPVVLCRERLAGGVARALVVNSGNANAANGPEGLLDARAMTSRVGALLGVPEHLVLAASTGVIGQRLPVDRPLKAMDRLVASLAGENWERAARAIMTTDTFPKAASRGFRLRGRECLMAGIAKGAGMIHPDMATLLAFFFTDAAVSAAALNGILHQVMAGSFNAITIDGDTSTNDTALVFASGLAGNVPLTSADEPEAGPLIAAFSDLSAELAEMIVRDGEGATKLIRVMVEGARDEAEANQVAMAVAKSPLVKTACFGQDPNWGRILAAVGYAGVPLDPATVSIHLGDVPIVVGGVRAPGYREERGEEVMSREEIPIRIDLGLGQSRRTVLTCDFSHDYVSINADYRT
ncbi:MAG: bifunctional glutamate N-acetyltransferase/amino-acid acetyltransferase ArgJ [Magnetococcales bacterium]|nr:bifunctional glutamate N-acetyltransferase/amino-acid acetyltransferase ArgJ [Magnetococcales bacterium]